MRTTMWAVLRIPFVRVIAVMAVVVGLVAGLSHSADTWSDVQTALSAGRTAILLLGSACAAVLWGTLNDASAQVNHHVAGVDTRLQWRHYLAATLMLVLGLGAAVSGPAYVVMRLGSHAPIARPTSPVTVAPTGLAWVATALLVTALVAVLCRHRGLASALAVGLAIPALHLLLSSSSGAPGLTLAKSLWPTTAVSVVIAGREGQEASAGAVASVSLSVSVLLIMAALRRPLFPPLEGTRREGQHVSARVVHVATAAVLVLGGVFLPAGASSALPAAWRPSLLLERVAGEAPEQVTRDMFAAVWRGDARTADRLTASGHVEDLFAGAKQVFLTPSREPSYLLSGDTTLDRAEVLATLNAGQVHVCLERMDNAWEVTAISATPCLQTV